MKAANIRVLLEAVDRAVSNGVPVAVATIVSRNGSAPQKVGAKMVVFEDGTIAGTVGGGCSEAEVIRLALLALDTGVPILRAIELTADVAEQEGMVCGGNIEVFIEPVASRRTKLAADSAADSIEGDGE